MSGRRASILAAALALVSCYAEPEVARPALWSVNGPNGERAWLFGTIHALDRPAQWRTPTVEKALSASDMIVVEVRDVADDAAMREAFTRLARRPGLPPLAARVAPEHRQALDRLARQAGLDGAAGGRDIETWAAALMLARAESPEMDERNGIDRAVIASARGRPVVELEGAAGQLAIFDRLPEREQRDLLTLVLEDAGALDTDDPDLARAWREGDMATIEAETRNGLLADPELRAALFTGRNRAWAKRLAGTLSRGKSPFVAVGAAHMAGDEGLPAILGQMGFRVRRIQ